MKDGKYDIILIGCGHIGSIHLDDIYTKENINIYAVIDLEIDRAKYFAKKYGARYFGTDYREWIKDANVDIVICATYPNTHLDILRCCVKYNKHLICEKPITPDYESAKEFVDLVKNSNIKVQVGFILRFNKTYQKVAQMIQDGMIGSPIVIRMTQNHHVINWKKYRALLENASPIVDCGVHYIDLCRWYTGAEIINVDGIAQTIDKETPENTYNYGLIVMRLSDGSIAYYEAGWGGSVAAENVKEFIGPKGRITILERDNRSKHKEEGDLIEFYDKEKQEYRQININCKRRPTGDQLDHLINMIENDVSAKPSIDDVMTGFEIVLSADEKLSTQNMK